MNPVKIEVEIQGRKRAMVANVRMEWRKSCGVVSRAEAVAAGDAEELIELILETIRRIGLRERLEEHEEHYESL